MSTSSSRKRKTVGKLLRKLWSSLESHIDWTIDSAEWKFHVKCVKEYAEDIKTAADLL